MNFDVTESLTSVTITSDTVSSETWYEGTDLRDLFEDSRAFFGYTSDDRQGRKAEQIRWRERERSHIPTLKQIKRRQRRLWQLR